VNYRKFREALEILIAYGMRDYSPANQQHGIPRNRIGVRQKSSLALPLTFQNMGRTNETSVYAAPLYGPSLRYLDLIGGYAVLRTVAPHPFCSHRKRQKPGHSWSMWIGCYALPGFTPASIALISPLWRLKPSTIWHAMGSILRSSGPMATMSSSGHLEAVLKFTPVVSVTAESY